jgi:hypothetical protein
MGVLIGQVGQLQQAPVGCRVELEVDRPDLVGSLARDRSGCSG